MTIETPSLDALRAELAALQLNTFNYDFAWKLGSLIRQRAASQELPVAIEIRHGTDVVFATLLPGATIDNFGWTRRKCAVVHRFHRSSLQVRLESELKGYDFNTRFGLPTSDYVASGGAFPLTIRGGTLIGSVGVSGLPDVEDHKLVTLCLTEMLAG
jgi:uncharacterized protein (UPF0303 family)